MAQRARVPKFGNWEGDGKVPYTQYFDNARMNRVGGKLVNPNDPQENPDAFSEDVLPVHASPVRAYAEPPKPKDDTVARKPTSDSPHHRYGDRMNSGEPHRKAGRMSGGSERSIEQSPLHPHYQVKSAGKGGVSSPSWERKGTSEGSHGHAPNTPGRTRTRPGGRGDEAPKRDAAVPKFGEWETDPASADGYTHIFDIVSKEKQTGAAKVPVMPDESSYYYGRKQNSSSESVICGCFSWGKK